MKKEITVTQYQEGIFDICEFLVVDMIQFLKEEGRYKYRMIDYMKVVMDNFSEAHKLQTEEDTNIYGRVLYVLNRIIIREYKRLRIKRLSPADSLICIILKLINTSESLEGGNNKFMKEQQQMKEIFQKFHDNIRNRAKNDHLWKIETVIKESVETSRWGTLSLEELDIHGLEHPAENKEQKLIGEKATWKEELSEEKEVRF